MNFRFSGYGISDIGLTRDGNEDSGLLSSFCIAVADGMGGHAGGEIASKIAIQKLNSADRKSTRLNSSHSQQSRMPSSA